MRLYETGLIFNPQLEEAEYDNQINKVTNLIESNSGKIEKIDRWGVRNMAYEIKKMTQGFYVFFYYTSSPEVPLVIENVMRINEDCLRFLTIRPDYQIDFGTQQESAPRVESEKPVKTANVEADKEKSEEAIKSPENNEMDS